MRFKQFASHFVSIRFLTVYEEGNRVYAGNKIRVQFALLLAH